MTTDNTQQQIVKSISEANKELQHAHQIGVKKNPMAQDLPVFQRLVKMQKELGEVMQEISKIRGL